MFTLLYRPQSVSEIDCVSLKERVAKMLKSKNIPHAILLTGPKGTGKTSIARIIAKSINCYKNLFAGESESYEPCNECASCIAITKASSADVFELDAASNRRIDDMRELIATIKFAPLTSRNKVYIIDEVHMLTIEAFNSILKTLEEPPPHVVFILATTEVEKLPKTIISRCTHFSIPKPTHSEIMNMLLRITKKEKLKVPSETLQFIASHCDNSFRDAAKLLEEASLHKDFSIKKIRSLIGFIGDEDFFLEFFEKNDEYGFLKALEEYTSLGGNCKVLTEQLLIKLQALFLEKKGIVKNTKESTSLSLEQIIALMKALLKAYSEFKYSIIESIPLEIAVVEYMSKAKKINENLENDKKN